MFVLTLYILSISINITTDNCRWLRLVDKVVPDLTVKHHFVYSLRAVEKTALLLMLFFYKSIIQVQRHNDCRSIDKNIYNSLNENTTEIS